SEPEDGVTLDVREEVVAFGTMPADSGLRLSVFATNSADSTGAAQVGGLAEGLPPGATFTRSIIVATAAPAPPDASTDAQATICAHQCARVGAASTDNCGSVTTTLIGSS